MDRQRRSRRRREGVGGRWRGGQVGGGREGEGRGAEERDGTFRGSRGSARLVSSVSVYLPRLGDARVEMCTFCVCVQFMCCDASTRVSVQECTQFISSVAPFPGFLLGSFLRIFFPTNLLLLQLLTLICGFNVFMFIQLGVHS